MTRLFSNISMAIVLSGFAVLNCGYRCDDNPAADKTPPAEKESPPPVVVRETKPPTAESQVGKDTESADEKTDEESPILRQKETAPLSRPAEKAVQQSVPGGCTVDGRIWRLEISPKNTSKDTLVELQQIFGREHVRCNEDGGVVAAASSEKLKELYGPHILLQCTSGAGNRVGAAAYSARLTPKGIRPKRLVQLVRHIAINTDPKAELTGGHVDCASLFK